MTPSPDQLKAQVERVEAYLNDEAAEWRGDDAEFATDVRALVQSWKERGEELDYIKAHYATPERDAE